MKRLIFIPLFLLNIFLVFPQAVFSQVMDNYSIGSAKTLEGSTYILKCFISDYRDEWSHEEKLIVINKYHEATNWLKEQALRYNVRIGFTGGVFGLTNDVKLDNIETGTGSGLENVRLISIVLRRIGYADSLAFYNWAKDQGFDNVLVILFAKGSGTGYAMSMQSEDMDRGLFYLEGAILYEKYQNGLDLVSSSIAHEILHNFGAWDLYVTFRQQFREMESFAREHFSNSIMHRVGFDINNLSVDPLTAWRIGWNKTSESWFYALNPYN